MSWMFPRVSSTKRCSRERRSCRRNQSAGPVSVLGVQQGLLQRVRCVCAPGAARLPRMQVVALNYAMIVCQTWGAAGRVGRKEELVSKRSFALSAPFSLAALRSPHRLCSLPPQRSPRRSPHRPRKDSTAIALDRSAYFHSFSTLPHPPHSLPLTHYASPRTSKKDAIDTTPRSHTLTARISRLRWIGWIRRSMQHHQQQAQSRDKAVLLRLHRDHLLQCHWLVRPQGLQEGRVPLRVSSPSCSMFDVGHTVSPALPAVRADVFFALSADTRSSRTSFPTGVPRASSARTRWTPVKTCYQSGLSASSTATVSSPSLCRA